MKHFSVFNSDSDAKVKYLFTDELIDLNILRTEEMEQVKGFSTNRLKEFFTGRALAKKGLKAWGCENLQVLRGPDGEPLWPDGFIGSISHCKSVVGAAIGKSDQIKSIGIDIEKIGKVKKDIWNSVFTENEQCFVNKLNPGEQLKYTVLYFSLKEAFYKMQYPLTKEKMWFTDVEFTFKNNTIQVYIRKDIELLKTIPAPTFKFEVYKGHVFTSCILEH